MTPWKKVVLAGFGVGLGLAVSCIAILAGISWLESRPKPWDNTAITAEYDTVGVDGNDNHVVFYYVLENKTKKDYRLDQKNDITVSGYLGKQKSLTTIDSDDLTVSVPLFIPTGHRQRIKVHL